MGSWMGNWLIRRRGRFSTLSDLVFALHFWFLFFLFILESASRECLTFWISRNVLVEKVHLYVFGPTRSFLSMETAANSPWTLDHTFFTTSKCTMKIHPPKTTFLISSSKHVVFALVRYEGAKLSGNTEPQTHVAGASWELGCMDVLNLGVPILKLFRFVRQVMQRKRIFARLFSPEGSKNPICVSYGQGTGGSFLRRVMALHQHPLLGRKSRSK